MGYIPMLWHISLKKFFRFFYFPDPEPGGFVDLMLKKNRHGLAFHLYFAASQKLSKDMQLNGASQGTMLSLLQLVT